MKAFRIIIVVFIGLTSLSTFAQNNIEGLPSIILSILESGSKSDIVDVDPLLELRALQSREVNVQTGELLSITTITYDSAGRVERQVQQFFSNGQVDGRLSTSTFEYDVLDRAESSITTNINELGQQTSIVNARFNYIPFENNLSQVVFMSSGEGGVSTLVQNFEYETLSRISNVTSTITSDLTGAITVQAIPSYEGGRINSIVQTLITPFGDSTETRALGFSGAEHTSTVITRGSSTEQVSLSFSSTRQVITRGLPGSRFTDTSEYENGDCDASNEANRRLIGLFAITTSNGGLGRQCR